MGKARTGTNTWPTASILPECVRRQGVISANQRYDQLFIRSYGADSLSLTLAAASMLPANATKTQHNTAQTQTHGRSVVCYQQSAAISSTTQQQQLTLLSVISLLSLFLLFFNAKRLLQSPPLPHCNKYNVSITQWLRYPPFYPPFLPSFDPMPKDTSIYPDSTHSSRIQQTAGRMLRLGLLGRFRAPSSRLRRALASVSEQYERKTPLEHVLLRPGECSAEMIANRLLSARNNTIIELRGFGLVGLRACCA